MLFRSVVQGSKSAVDLVVEGKARCAIVSEDFYDKVEGVIVEIIEVNGKAAAINIEEENGVKHTLVVGEDRNDLVKTINKDLLPRLYTMNPKILVLKAKSLDTPDMEYLKHQLMVFKKLIVVLANS